MKLREILQVLVDNGNPPLFDEKRVQREPGVLLSTLSESVLERKSYLQPGLYIAEINDAGYLGSILYRFRNHDEERT